MAFNLSEWIDYWIGEFSAKAHTLYGGYPFAEPIDDKWIRIINTLEHQSDRYAAQIASGERKNKTNPAQDMLDKLLGPQLLKYASDAYWETGSMVKTGIPEWQKMSLEDRGRVIAYNRIHNAVEGLTRYATELKANSEREKQKRKQAKAPRSRGRKR